MKKTFFTILSILLINCTFLAAKETNILVIASTRPFDHVKGIQSPKESTIINLVKSTAKRDLRKFGKINIVFEDVFRQKKIDTAYGGSGSIHPSTYQCHSLAQWYFWPEGRKERLVNLEGKGGTEWNFVFIVGDAYIIEHMPGIYAEGVKLIADKVRKGTAKPILLLPWGKKSSSKATMLSEVVYRVGTSSDIPVFPKTVASKVKRLCAGEFDKTNVFAMKYVDKRHVTYNHTGTSSERGIEKALQAAARRCRIKMSRSKPGKEKIDFNYGRANSNFEKNKQYKVDPDKFGRSYGFPMQDHSKSAEETMLYGIDKRGEDGTDLGIAWDMIRQKEIPKDVRCIPIRLLWAKLHDADPEMKPLRDRWHMSRYLDTASATFIYTLLSGRCPIAEKPSTDDKNAYRDWLGQRIGYETAWRISHLNDRVPGFTVRPQDLNTNLNSGAKTNMEVSFLYPPSSPVKVNISLDKKDAANVEPKSLIFTPENYNKIQTITVTSQPVNSTAKFNINFVTQSEDNVFAELKDSWPYTNNP